MSELVAASLMAGQMANSATTAFIENEDENGMDNRSSEHLPGEGRTQRTGDEGLPLPRADLNGLPPEFFGSKTQIAIGLQRYLLEGWRALSPGHLRTLGIDPQCSDCLEEEGLTYLAWALLDCANLTLAKAMAAKRARLRASDVV